MQSHYRGESGAYATGEKQPPYELYIMPRLAIESFERPPCLKGRRVMRVAVSVVVWQPLAEMHFAKGLAQ